MHSTRASLLHALQALGVRERSAGVTAQIALHALQIGGVCVCVCVCVCMCLCVCVCLCVRGGSLRA